MIETCGVCIVFIYFRVYFRSTLFFEGYIYIIIFFVFSSQELAALPIVIELQSIAMTYVSFRWDCLKYIL